MSKRNKMLIGTLSVLLVCAFVVGISYAYWRLTYTQTGVNKIVSSCFSMELANEKNSITLDSAYPISDEKGKSLTPYSFTITNTCDLFASYTINLEMLEGTTLDSKYIKTMINSEAITNLNSLETTDTSIEGTTESRVLFRGSLGAGDSTDYTLRIWMDSDTPFSEDSMNKIFQSKITVTAEVSTYSPVENGFTNLAEALLVNEYQTTSLDIAKERIASKQEVDFSKSAPIIEWQAQKTNNSSVNSSVKADPLLIGQYGITENATKTILGKSYSFDPVTGYYHLEETDYYDLTNVDFNNDDYYWCGSGIRTSADSKVTDYNNLSCVILYKVYSLKSVSDVDIVLNNGETINSKVYLLDSYVYKSFELESDKSDKGLYQHLDDDGITYYYRGSVSNNIVKYAGFYWKVIRINGDGSVRLLYVGANPDKISSIDIGVYHIIADNPTYVGYMYSNTLNSSYEDTIANDNDSTIKTKLDRWYKTNILDTGYSSYIADSGFCNDRSLSSGDGFNSTTVYAAKDRFTNSTPIFTCLNSNNDLFTLDGNNKGNSALTYPIGLITMDELIFSGVVSGYLNTMSYLHSDSTYWTMTPIQYREAENASRVALYSENGTLGYSVIKNKYSILPVINLKADTEITRGIGTKNDPFIVK